MKHTVLTACLALILAFCLTACGCRHEWMAATCEAPKTCRSCGAAEGEALPHVPGDWMLSGSDYVNAENQLVRKCTGCGMVLEEYTSAMDSFHNGIHFLSSAEDFAERLALRMQLLQEGYGEYSAEIIADGDGKAQLNLYCTNGRIRETVGELSFGTGGNTLDFDRKDAKGSYLAVGGIVSTDHLAVVMPALVQAADPAMDIPGAFAYSEQWISERTVECNGLTYGVAAGNESAAALMISVGS